jgi:hydroxymethylpyrimidine pyrophosphatase-like HAD family hydrolase
LSYAFRRVESFPGFANVTGISTLLPDKEAAKVRKTIRDIVGNSFKVIYTRQTRCAWLEVVHPEVRKDLSIQRLCREMGIPPADVIYFGDNFNDKEALRLVGHAILVENAAPELKREFTTIIRPVTEEGVAHYLNEIFSLDIK